MELRGRMRNGVVVFEVPPPVADGTEVTVRVAEFTPEAASPKAGQSIWDKLQAVAGTAHGLPPDASVQHDHYLYGTPKRSE